MRRGCIDAEDAVYASARSGAALPAEVAQHLRECSDCARHYGEAVHIARLLQQAASAPPAPDCRDAVAARIRPGVAARRPRPLWAYGAAGAAAVIILALASRGLLTPVGIEPGLPDGPPAPAPGATNPTVRTSAGAPPGGATSPGPGRQPHAGAQAGRRLPTPTPGTKQTASSHGAAASSAHTGLATSSAHAVAKGAAAGQPGVRRLAPSASDSRLALTGPPRSGGSLGSAEPEKLRTSAAGGYATGKPVSRWVVAGRVTDAEGNGLPGVKVVAATAPGRPAPTGSATTDSNGIYRFGLGLAAPGRMAEVRQMPPVLLSVQKPGYFETSQGRDGYLWAARPPRVLAGAQGGGYGGGPGGAQGRPQAGGEVALIERNFVMRPAAKIEGVLLDAVGHPLAGKQVQVLAQQVPGAPATPGLSVKTDAQGRFAFHDVPTQQNLNFAVGNSTSNAVQVAEARPHFVELQAGDPTVQNSQAYMFNQNARNNVQNQAGPFGQNAGYGQAQQGGQTLRAVVGFLPNRFRGGPGQGAPAGAGSVTLHAERTTWPAGEKPTLTADLRNTGKADWRSTQVSLECDGVWYENPSLSLGTAFAAGRGIPGLRLTLSDEWRSQKDGRPLALAPGRHSVRLRLAYQHDDRMAAVLSNPLTLTVEAGK